MSRAEDEARARQRFLVLNAARLGGLGLVLLGIVIARGALPLGVPWVVGVIIAVAGLLEFFFLPRLIARRWKSEGAGGVGPR
jgi:hypothetical protein